MTSKREGRTPSFPETIKHAVSALLSAVHTAIPGYVVSYNAELRKATVQPYLKRNTEDGEERLPAITNVPIIFPGGGGGTLTFPITTGDTVLILFSERSLDNWLTSGREGTPGDVRKFDLIDAIAIPGLQDFKNAVAADSGDVVLYHGGSKVAIDSSGNVEIGAGSFQALVNKAGMDQYNDHDHPYGSGGTTGKPNQLMVDGTHTTEDTKAT